MSFCASIITARAGQFLNPNDEARNKSEGAKSQTRVWFFGFHSSLVIRHSSFPTMNFSGHKRRRPPSVIIGSLIDVLLVVLIFLMVTTAFKDTPAFKVPLPETTHQPPQPGMTAAPPLTITIT